MAHFEYRALTANGSAISGVVEADDFDSAMEQLAQMKLEGVEISKAKPPGPKRSIGGEDFIFFNEQLASLASAGMCLDEGLRRLAHDVESPKLRGVINAIACDVEKGIPLEQAVANHEDRLPIFYGRVVRAGVQSGQLPATLLNLSQHLRLLTETKRIILEALAYPVTVCLFAVAIVTLFLAFVVPMFEELFMDFDTRLPGATMLLIDLSRVFPAIALTAGVVVAVCVAAWFALRATPGGRRVRERVAMCVPVVGSVFRASLVSRFARSLALMVSSGVPLPESLRLAGGATGSATLGDDAERLATDIEQGLSPNAAGDALRLIPRMFGFVVEIAIGRNALPEAMFQLARAYDLRAAHAQSMLRGYLVPLSIVFVGLLVGFFIASLFLPLISLINSVSGG
ncbi:MAG TPA: type II secretion system F family protein [Phycisphaerae bacterium]|nr:type II secretion system F family protein [Phycisphaerae bacterium]